MHIKILNWDEYQPRKDLKHAHWARLDAAILHSKKFHGATHETLWVFTGLVLLAVAENKNGELIGPKNWICDELRILTQPFDSAISFLEQAGIIQVITEPYTSEQARTDPYASVPYETNETNETKRESPTSQLDPPSEFFSGPTPKDLAQLWNVNRHPAMPEIRIASLKSGSPRWVRAKSRLAEEPSLDFWGGVIQRIARSSFCRGENDRHWRANFDWLVKRETATKALEGLYDDNKRSKPARKFLNIEELDAEPNAVGKSANRDDSSRTKEPGDCS